MNAITDHTATAATRASTTPLDVEIVRRDFPVLDQTVHGKPLAYLDNAATSQKPTAVIETIERYYREDNANIHRGVHTLSERATAAFEATREKVRRFLNAESSREIVFLRGTTEAINLVAQSYARPRLQPGDEIIVSEMEHHSNIVPWQIVCEQTGATLRVLPINERGELEIHALDGLIGPNTKLIAVGHVSNALGTVNPVAEITRRAHERDIPVVVDGAQATPHMAVDVRALGADFYAFSGHKMFGPTGAGALYGRLELLEEMPPYQGGGEMIRSVSFHTPTVYNDVPAKFEAGTPNIAGVIGLGAAIDYLERTGLERIAAREAELLAHATETLEAVPGLRIIGTARQKTAVISFVIDRVHPHDLGTILDHEGIAIRTGHHCAQPVMEHFGVPATARSSMAFYNTREETERLAEALDRAREVFA